MGSLAASSYLHALLLQVPETQERLRQEQAAVMAKHGQGITPAALADMPFTEAVVREVREAGLCLPYQVAMTAWILGSMNLVIV